VGAESLIAKEPMIGPYEQAGQRAQKSDGQVGLGPPGDHATIDKGCSIVVCDEIVKIERPPSRRQRSKTCSSARG